MKDRELVIVLGGKMKLLSVCGALHRTIIGFASKKIDIVNKDELTLKDLDDFLKSSDSSFDAVIITDEAFSGQLESDRHDLEVLLERIARSHKPGSKVLLLTKDFLKETELGNMSARYGNFAITTFDMVRIPVYVIEQAFEELLSCKNQPKERIEVKEKPEEKEKKKSFLDRFRPKPKNDPKIEATDPLARSIENISRGLSRIVAITGHRGSGLTSTVVNVACEAAKRGLSSIIIDMDIDYRSTNMYFGSFHEATKRDEDMNASLVRTLARPQDYMITAFNIKDKLWMTSLGYDFSDRKLIEQFYNNSKLVGLLSVLRNRFNLIILDMPLDLFKTFKDTLIHIDVFGLCVSNNLHSVLSTLRNLDVVLDRENVSYMNAKTKVIVTKYNDRSRFQSDIFVPDRVAEILSSGISDSFTYEVKVAGHIPYSNDFDTQIEMDVPMVNTSGEFERAYGNILLRLMEGIK